ncbi:7570_t:CDS:2, partial [Dentiscutata heterogama]
MIFSTCPKPGVIFFILGVLLLCNLVSTQDNHKWEKVLTHSAFPEYQIKYKEPKLCDENVQQYSGYIDVSTNKSLFFWFFESRNKPHEDPLVLWITGGPGCSSLNSLFFEVGPCTIKGDGNGPINSSFSRNYNSLNNIANIIFLDQPTNAGYSYGDKVSTTLEAASDIYAFLQIFFQNFPEYAKLDFHIAGESYAGHFSPAVAAEIYYNNNKKNFTHINLESILIGNGLVDPLLQFKYYPDMACNSSYGPVLNISTCDQMRKDYKRCANLTEICYSSKSAADCSKATALCFIYMIEPYQASGRSLADVRKSCNDIATCYPDLITIGNFSDRTDFKNELGANSSLKYKICNSDVFTDFSQTGDIMLSFIQSIPPLLEDNIRVLIYAGDADFLCNWMGNEAWVKELEWSGKKGFNNANVTRWITKDASNHAGDVRTFKGLTFLRVFKAGHMPPHDQSSSSFDFFSRWLSKED